MPTEITTLAGFREETVDIAFESASQVAFKIAGQRADDSPLDVTEEYTYTRGGFVMVQGHIRNISQKLGNRVDEQSYVLMDRYGDLKKELLIKYGTTRFTLNPDRPVSNPIAEEFAEFTPIWTVVPIASAFAVVTGTGGGNISAGLSSVYAADATSFYGTSLEGMAKNIVLENQLNQMYITQNASNDNTVSSFMADIGDFLIPDDVTTFKQAIEFFVKDSDVLEGLDGVKVVWFDDPEGILDTKIENNISMESRFIGEIIEEFLRYVPTVRFYYSPQTKQLIAVNLKAGTGKNVLLNRMFTNHFERHQRAGTPYSEIMEINIDIDETNCYQSIHLEGSGYYGRVIRTLIPQFPYTEYGGAGCEGSLYAADLMFNPYYTLFGKSYKFPSIPSPTGFEGGTYGGSGDIEIFAMCPFAHRYSCIGNSQQFVNINMPFFGIVECCGQLPHVWNDWRWFSLYSMGGDVKLNSNGDLVIVSPIRLMHSLNIFGFSMFGTAGDVLVPTHGHRFTEDIPCVDFSAITEFDGDNCQLPMGPMFVPWVLAAKYWEKRGPLSVYLTGGCFNGKTFTRYNKDWGYAVSDDQINDPNDSSGWPYYGGDVTSEQFRAPLFRAKDGYNLDFTYGGFPVAGMENNGVIFGNPEANVETIDADAVFVENGGIEVIKDDREKMAAFARNLADVLFIPKVSGTIKIHLFLKDPEDISGTNYNPPLTVPEVSPFGSFGVTWALGDKLSIEYDQYETQGPGEIPSFRTDIAVNNDSNGNAIPTLVNVDPTTWDKLNISVVGLHYNRYDQTLTLDVANSAYAYGDRVLEGLQR